MTVPRAPRTPKTAPYAVVLDVGAPDFGLAVELVVTVTVAADMVAVVVAVETTVDGEGDDDAEDTITPVAFRNVPLLVEQQLGSLSQQ